MCKLLAGINLKGEQNKEFESLIMAQREEIKTEKNGIAGIVIDKEDKLFIYRDLEDYDGVLDKTFSHLAEAKLVALHSRQRTSGNTDLKNVHFFEIDNYLLAHNGLVGAYHSYKGWQFSAYPPKKRWDYKTQEWEEIEEDENIAIPHSGNSETDVISQTMALKIQGCKGCFSSNKGFCKKHRKEYAKLLKEQGKENKTEKKDSDAYSDSYQFLKNIPKPITLANLEKEAEEKEFSGFGVIVKTNEPKSVFLIIARPNLHLALDDKETFGIFSSYKLENEQQEISIGKFVGVDFIQSSEKKKIEFKNFEVVEGIYQINLERSVKNKILK